MKLLKAEWEVNQQEGGEEFKCHMIWQVMVALRGTDEDRGKETLRKDVKNPLYRWRLLTMMNQQYHISEYTALQYEFWSYDRMML